jgi:hypothetical protein
MSDVTIVRLYVLRFTYVLLATGLALNIWPDILSPPPNLSHMATVVRAVLGTVGVMAVIGVRYPLKMLPLLFFELIWKTIWVVAFGIPLWRHQQFTPDTRDTFNVCLVSVVLMIVVIPWGYVFWEYIRAPGDRWWTTRARTAKA